MYMDFACCAAVPGGGRNKEYALHLLHLCKGNVQVCQQKNDKPIYICICMYFLLICFEFLNFFFRKQC